MASGPIPLSTIHSTHMGVQGNVRPMVRARRPARTLAYSLPKRVMDVLLSCVLLLLLAPLLALIAIIIKLDSPGPALYVQRRVGKGGRVFRFYKFRSMWSNMDHSAEHRQYCREYINGHNGSSGEGTHNGHFKPPTNGHSVTSVGRWLRKYSLDELPQLVNVLKGDMSLVGPRPSLDYEVEVYKDWHCRRLCVLPGITGLAQINGRSTLAFDDIVRFDIQYIEQRSAWLDLRILLKTAPVVLFAHGAS
jgi:lipopolysaccharide/colanic/teichoic acid biosynthesis glycosyltransferase